MIAGVYDRGGIANTSITQHGEDTYTNTGREAARWNLEREVEGSYFKGRQEVMKTMADLLEESGVKMHLYCRVCKKPFIQDYPQGHTGGIKVVCGEECLKVLRGDKR